MKIYKNKILIVSILIIIFFLSIVIGIFFGSTGHLLDGNINTNEIIMLRLPRVLLALITGGALAISGAVLQSILENPLAEPFLLGVSGGAVLGGTVGMVFCIALFDSVFSLRLFAFVGAISSIFLLIYINQKNGRLNPINMLLTGVVFNGFVSAIVTIFKAFIPAIKLQKVTLWLSGYIPYVSIQDVIFEMVLVFTITFFLILDSGRLDILSLGEDIATTSGINVYRLRQRMFIFTSLLIGIVVSMTGLIGFVGLIIPQLLRFLKIISNKSLLPLSFMMGGCFTVLSDLLCRVVSGKYGFEPPISSVTALIGAPIFVFLLREYFKEKVGT